MSATRDSYSATMALSPSPPTDLGAYARFMHQHTKRQMEAISTQEGSSSSSSSTQPNGQGVPTGLPDGVVASNRSRNASGHSY